MTTKSFEGTSGRRRVAVVGGGPMGLQWAQAVDRNEGLALAAIIDIDYRQARGTALRLRRPELAKRSLEDLDVAIDLCVNTTPPGAHFQVVADALKRELHVLTEKPFAESFAEAKQLMELAISRRRVLMVSQSRTYEPGLSQLRDLLRHVGELGSIDVRFWIAHPALGFRSTIDHPLLLDMAVHTFDAVRFLTGDEAVDASCEEHNPHWSPFAGAATAAVVFKMSGGWKFSYAGSWCGPGCLTSWSGDWLAAGERGLATWDGLNEPAVTLCDAEANELSPGPSPVVAASTSDPAAGLDRVLDDFVRRLAGGGPAWGDATNNLGTMAMVGAAITSAESGLRVQMPHLDKVTLT